MKQMTGQESRVVNLVTKGLFAAIVVCLLVAVAGFWWAGENQPRTAFMNVQILPEEQAQTRVVSGEVVDRPLFWNSRRPVALAADEKVERQPLQIAEPLQGVKLLGIIAKQPTYLALLDVDGSIERIQQGSTVKGWQVFSITDREVQLKNQGETSILTLIRDIHESIKLEH
jgi:hypothetical protein